MLAGHDSPLVKPTPARAPGLPFPLGIFPWATRYLRCREGSGALVWQLRYGGRTARSPAIPRGSCESRGARTRFQGARRGDAHRGSEPLSPVPVPATLRSCRAATPARGSLLTFPALTPLPLEPAELSDRVRKDGRLWWPETRGGNRARPAARLHAPGSRTRPPAPAGARAPRIGAAPSGGDGLGRALRGRRAASGRQQGAELTRL